MKNAEKARRLRTKNGGHKKTLSGKVSTRIGRFPLFCVLFSIASQFDAFR